MRPVRNHRTLRRGPRPDLAQPVPAGEIRIGQFIRNQFGIPLNPHLPFKGRPKKCHRRFGMRGDTASFIRVQIGIHHKALGIMRFQQHNPAGRIPFRIHRRKTHGIRIPIVPGFAHPPVPHVKLCDRIRQQWIILRDTASHTPRKISPKPEFVKSDKSTLYYPAL